MSDFETAKRALTDEEPTSPKVDALIEAMFLAATADGEFAPEEALQFVATVEALSNRKVARESIEQRLATLKSLLRAEGRPARLAAVAARIPKGKPRETALLLAAAITASDGEVRLEENDLLADLAETLGIDQDRAIELIQRVQQAPPR
jgi:tellurite resistance protein